MMSEAFLAPLKTLKMLPFSETYTHSEGTTAELQEPPGPSRISSNSVPKATCQRALRAALGALETLI